MKRYTQYFILIVSAVFFSIKIYAQGQTPFVVQSTTITSFQNYAKDRFFISWEIAFPSNGSYLSKTSFAGGRIEYRKMIDPQMSIGIAGSWNSFEEHTPRQTYQKPDGTGAVTTDLVRTIYTVPVTLEAHRYFSTSGKVQPYAGVGLGAQYSEQDAYFNIYNIEETNWGFVVRPEIGVIIPFNAAVGAYVSGAFNFSTNQNDAFDINSLQHFAVNVGLTFSVR